MDDPYELKDLKIDELQLYVEFLGGMSPVEGWGTIADRYWLFHARYDSWGLEVALEKDIKIPWVDCDTDAEKKYCVEGEYGAVGGFDASYIPVADALEIVKQHARIFLDRYVENV